MTTSAVQPNRATSCEYPIRMRTILPPRASDSPWSTSSSVCNLFAGSDGAVNQVSCHGHTHKLAQLGVRLVVRCNKQQWILARIVINENGTIERLSVRHGKDAPQLRVGQQVG